MAVKKLLHLLALVVGVVGFAIVVDRVGWASMQRAVTDAGWWFLVIAVIDLASVFSDSAGLYCFVRAESPVSYWRVFAAQASGIAINRLTPGNTLGEGVKAAMIIDHVAVKSTAVSSVVKFNLATLYVALAVVVIGVPLTLLGLDLAPRATLIVWIGTSVVIVFGIVLALLLRRGAVATLINVARALGIVSKTRAVRWTERVATVDANIRAFGNPWSRRGVAFIVLSRVLHSAAIICVLRAAAVPMTLPIVIGMLSVGIVVTWMSGVVPLGLGLADGTNYVLYAALGSSPVAGLAFTMVNRTRTCVLAAMGLCVLAIANLVDRSAQRPLSVRDPDVASDARTEASVTS